ncbi:MAG: cell division protein ZapA [Spirochaetia bacterium]|nr:cell division protein ZapA [Leptospirales bacterium]MCE9597246.1 cell division protein ZapA [Spirochaetia bacterium]
MSAAKTTVNILGETFTIRGEASEDYIAEIARMVDSTMRDIKSQQQSLDRFRLAVLAAINLADELMRKRQTPDERSDEQLSQRTRQLIDLLDEGLVGERLAG